MHDLRHKKIWVAGHNGLAGGAVLRRLSSEPCDILTVARNDLDLRRQQDTENWIAQNKPDAIILAAAMVGGIADNAARPGDFMYDNIMIQSNVIHAAAKSGAGKLVFLGSSCIYPREAQQPIREDMLMTGPLEPTNEAYALAKIAGIKLCQSYRRQHGCDFISIMPCNLYGPGDTYDTTRSHVIPAMIMKIEAARQSGAPDIELWGTGTPLREFMHVDDLADAVVFLLKNYSYDMPVNVGSGDEITISDLARTIADLCGYKGSIRFNPAHPDGTPRKIMDSSCLHAMGWQSRISLRDGLKTAIDDYRTRSSHARAA